MVKTYILDTNILMSTEGKVLFGFADNEVVITHTTLEELDRLKDALGERGYQARESIRVIDEIVDNRQEKESILDGIKLNNGGTFKMTTNYLQATMPNGWSLDRADNRILCTAKTLSDQVNTKVILITNDVNLKLKAHAMKIDVQDYKNDRINEEEFYSGRKFITVPDTVIDAIYKKGSVNLRDVLSTEDYLLEEEKDDILSQELVENEFICLKGYTNKSALSWRKGDSLVLIKADKPPVYGITAKNSGQKFAMEALLSSVEDIPLVILKGPAGCGKTLISLACGLDGAYDSKEHRKYDNVVITRSNTLSDEDLGFLPGDLEEKMTPLLAPFFDNLKFLVGKNIEEKSQINLQINDMLEEGVIEITSLSYIRGRSLTNTFLIVDEAQNLTRTQAKTIVTRMGIGSKLVILGDPNQIDNPKLDKKNNGLAYLSDKFKGSPLCAQIEFDNSESVRSKLALDAINRL